MTVLSVSAGLFFVFVLHIGFLPDGLTESNPWFFQLYIHFVTVKQLGGNDIQMLITHAVYQGLAVLAVVDHL